MADTISFATLLPLRRRGLVKRYKWWCGALGFAAGAAVVTSIVFGGGSDASFPALVLPQMPRALVVDGRTSRAFLTIPDRAGRPQGTVWLVDTRTGRLQRVVTVPVDPGPMVVDDRAGQVIVGDIGGTGVSILDAHTGTMVRGITVPGSVSLSSLAVDVRTHHLFLATLDGNVRTVDLTTGRMLTSASGQTLSSTSDLAIDTRTERVFIADRYAGASPLISRQQGTIRVLDAHSGRVLHTVAVGVNPRHVVVDARAHRVVVVNAGTGLTAGSLSVLDATSGRTIRTIALGYPIYALAPDASSGHMFTLGAGGVMILDVRTGRIRQAIALDGMPVAIAVDGTAGRLSILTEHEQVQASMVIHTNSISIFDTRAGVTKRSITVSEPLVINPNDANTPLLAVDNRARRIVAVVDGGITYAPVPSWNWIPSRLRAWLPFFTHLEAHARAVAPRLVVRAEP